MSTSVVLASRNAGKLAEMQALFAPLGWTLKRVSEFADVSPDETEPTFTGNALLKARHAARVSGLPALADDSGLCVDALGGVPGVESAYYAGKPSNDAANNQKLLRELGGAPDEKRGAQFVCVMAYVRNADDAVPVIAQGRLGAAASCASHAAATGLVMTRFFSCPRTNAHPPNCRRGLKTASAIAGRPPRCLLAEIAWLIFRCRCTSTFRGA